MAVKVRKVFRRAEGGTTDSQAVEHYARGEGKK